MEPPSIYSGLISPRSRRLRTIGIVLLAAIIAMFLYGYFQLMPAMERSIHEEKRLAILSPMPMTSLQARSLTRVQKVRKLKVAVVMAYWGVCSLLIVAACMVAWLDFREISRTYLAQRRAVWQQTVGSAGDEDRRT